MRMTIRRFIEIGATCVAMLGAASASFSAEAPPVYQLQLSPEGFQRLCGWKGKPGFSLPRFELFDHEGRSLWQIAGYSSDFSRDLEGRIDRGHGSRKADTLAEVLPLFIAQDGRRVVPSLLAESGFTLVEYWAEWCGPCKKQIADIRDLFQRRPDLDAKVLLVEADPHKLTPKQWPKTHCMVEGASASAPPTSRSPGVADDPVTKARALLRVGEYAKAFSAFRKLEKKGSCPPATCAAAYAIVAAEERETAATLEHAEEALDLVDSTTSVWDLNELGVRLARLEAAGPASLELAERALREAMARDEGGSSNVRFNLATVLEWAGREGEASRLMEELGDDLLIDPGLGILGDFAGVTVDPG